MKKTIMMLLALLAVNLAATAQQLSGKVTDANGGLEGVTVAEVDKNDRVLNQTTTDANGIFQLALRSDRNKVRVFKDGYSQITENINGRTMMRFTLTSKRTLDIDLLQTVKKPKGEDSKAIVESHGANGQETDQWVRIEQLTDTSYIFAIALTVQPQQETYPAGRGLLFLDLQDRISHHVRSGVDAEDEFGFRHFSYCSKSSTPRIEGSKTRESSSIVCSY